MSRIFGYKTMFDRRMVDVELKVMRTSEDVFWTERGNSYVLVRELLRSEQPEGNQIYSAPWLHNGVPCYCESINGMGETRWSLSPTDVYENDLSTPDPYPTDKEMMAVVQHFKLIPRCREKHHTGLQCRLENNHVQSHNYMELNLSGTWR